MNALCLALERGFAWGLVAVTLLCAGGPMPAADAPPKNAPGVAYDVFRDGYFVSNKFHPDAALTLAVFADRKSFEEAFGIARVMGKPPRFLPANAFEKNMVATVIHRGKKFWSYQVNQVEADGQTVVIRYTTDERASDSASFACPLIVMLPRGEFTAVRFIENGKSVGEVTLKERR